MQVKDEVARAWYEKEALRETWSVKTLQRNISSQYYHTILQSQAKEPVIDEMHQLTEEFQNDKLEIMKNPYAADYNTCITEVKSDLQSKARLELIDLLESIDQYDDIDTVITKLKEVME